MQKYKIERISFAESPKAWELWKDTTPAERLIALQKLRKITFSLKNEGDKQRSNVIDDISVNFIGIKDLIKNKKAVGRPKDLLDIENLPDA